jgi:hypothetical protein
VVAHGISANRLSVASQVLDSEVFTGRNSLPIACTIAISALLEFSRDLHSS